MKTRLLFITLGAYYFGFSQIPTDYYDSADGLSGFSLKTELKNIISNGHIDQGYGALYTAYLTTDNDNYYEMDNTVLDMYSENPAGADSYSYAHDTNGGTDPGDACGSTGFSAEGDCYNREHLFPQGFFDSASPMRSDVHHVVPSDGEVNGGRSNFPFGIVATATETFTNGSKVGTNGYPGYVGTVFEPIDEFKGDIARCLLYFATRYEDEALEAAVDGSGEWDPHTAENNPMDGSTAEFYESWFINLLISWHNADPVSQRELDRNEAAYNFQGNANPFISHPEYVEMIWTVTPPDTEAPSVPTDLAIVTEEATSIDISWVASTDNVGILNYDIYIDNSYNSTTSNTLYTITGLSSETTYDINVLARDTSGNTSELSEVIQGTTTVNNIIFEEDFNDCTTVGDSFFAFNEASDKNWVCEDSFGQDDTGSYQMNGFREDVASRDWLISVNSYDFDATNTELLSLYLDYRFGSTPLELIYSSDYTGSGDPSIATWTNVPNISIPTDFSDSEEKEIFFDQVDVSSITGTVYVAFRYYSNGSPTRWTIDSFKLIEKQELLNTPSFSDDTRFTVFPNPSNGNVEIQFVENQNIESLEIYNLIGKRVFSTTNIPTTNDSIELTNLPKGILLVNITSGSQLITKKLIVK
ncbi:hypothetical protein GCM10022393_32860 [Aquimarina addita]|uniref:Fibronectin type-III domain-containing protein n=1 Tax=Aquimarina addita TaxID=870485 RepID=A0ABP6US81_9FLAO